MSESREGVSVSLYASERETETQRERERESERDRQIGESVNVRERVSGKRRSEIERQRQV